MGLKKSEMTEKKKNLFALSKSTSCLIEAHENTYVVIYTMLKKKLPALEHSLLFSQ